MPATGKLYGLMVNWGVDDRRDIRKSTLSAVEYLKDLYSMFENWELAAAAYNAGEAKVARAIQRYGSRDFWVVSRHRFLRPETRDYVPKIIAAALVSKNRTQFGFAESRHQPSKDEAVAPDGSVVKLIKTDHPEMDLAEAEESLAEEGEEGLHYETASQLDGVNPAPQQGPATLNEVLSEGETSREALPKARSVPTPHVTRTGEVGGAELAEFEVQSPADLLKVARAAGLSYQTVKALNPELVRWCTPPTLSSYRIKLPVEVKTQFLKAYNEPDFPRRVQFMTYRVKKGESLSRIARSIGIKVDPVADLNGVSPNLALRKGAVVLLPIPNDRSRSLASLDLRDPPEKRKGRRGRRGRRFKVTREQRKSAQVHSVWTASVQGE